MGLTTGGDIGASTALKLADCPALIDAMAEAARAVRPDILVLCHGGPIATPDDATWILQHTEHCHGFYGASSMERLPTEQALTATNARVQVDHLLKLGRHDHAQGLCQHRPQCARQPRSGRRSATSTACRAGIPASRTASSRTGRPATRSGACAACISRTAAHIRERLLSFSDVDRHYSYNFEKTPFYVLNYHATLRVTPVTDGDRAFVEWWTTFDCPPERDDEWIHTFAGIVFKGGLDALKARFGG